jgi:cytochrome c554/c'-like protein
LILVAAVVVAAASCGSVVETPGAGGSFGTGSFSSASSIDNPNPTANTGGGPFSCDTDVYDLAGFDSSATCKDCHESIYNDWKFSMHSRSLTGPVFMATNNQIYDLDLKNTTAPDPQRMCVQCHSPIYAGFAGAQVVLPFKAEGDVPGCLLQEGVGCVTCHAYVAQPEVGAAGFSDFWNDFDASGLTYYGPLSNPANSPAHKSKRVGVLGTAPETLCINCHNVFLDTNADGKIVAGEDFILQNTSFEHDELYRLQRDETCVDCHMPSKAHGPAADGPGAPPDAPPTRALHHHGFPGADFPIDDADNDVQLGLRQELLQQAAAIEIQNAQLINGTQVTFSVTVTNVRAGHSLPTGFAFLRQLWVEASILDAMTKAELATSGVLKAPTDDLCDASTLQDALQNLVQGCVDQNKNVADPQLVNFQLKLVTDVDQALVNGAPVAVQAPGGQESSIPRVAGGQVARVRPVDGQSLAPLLPFESRSFAYSFTLPQPQAGVALEVALKFRGVVPYLMRALAQREPSLAERLTQNLDKLKPITVAKVVQTL